MLTADLYNFRIRAALSKSNVNLANNSRSNSPQTSRVNSPHLQQRQPNPTIVVNDGDLTSLVCSSPSSGKTPHSKLVFQISELSQWLNYTMRSCSGGAIMYHLPRVTFSMGT